MTAPRVAVPGEPVCIHGVPQTINKFRGTTCQTQGEQLPRVLRTPESAKEHLLNALMVIQGARETYDAHTPAQELYADLMAVEYRIQQALQQVEQTR